MTKNVNIKTTKTVTTETTITTATSVPANYMPIDLEKDPGAEDFYKANGIPVRSMEKFGKKRLYAIIPVENYDNLSEEEKVASAEKARAFSRNIDNHRRSSERVAARIARNENISLDSVMASGYDPTLDVIPFGVIYDEAKSDDDCEVTKTEGTDSSISEDDFEYASNTTSRGGYDSFSDDNNPEYIVAKKLLYAKLHDMIDELDGEDLKIVAAIMAAKSERQLAKELHSSRTTLQGHRTKLMDCLREILGDFFID